MNPIAIIIGVLVLGAGYWFVTQEPLETTEPSHVVDVAQRESVAVDTVIQEEAIDKDIVHTREGALGGEEESDRAEEGAIVKQEEDKMMDKEDGERTTAEQVSVMEKNEPESEPVSEPVAQQPGTYADYSAARVAEAEGDIVLFFAASWCPSCRTLDRDIQTNSDNIPSGVTILKVDYDQETDLKQQYAVTYQHTMVQVDNNGNQIMKWSGGNTLSSVIAQL